MTYLQHLKAQIEEKHHAAIEAVWLTLWAHPEGIACEQVLLNLKQAVTEEHERLKLEQLTEPALQDYQEELQHWQDTLSTMVGAHGKLPAEIQQVIRQRPMLKTSHPMSGHGLTAEGIYSGCWNQHQSTTKPTANISGGDSQKALRRLQWLCVRIQGQIHRELGITLDDYEKWFTGKNATLDYLGHEHGITTHGVGWALRSLSWNRHQSLLQLIDKSYAADLHQSILAMVTFANDAQQWACTDASMQKKQERIVDALRLFCKKALNPKRIIHKNRKGGGSHTNRGGTQHGFTGSVEHTQSVTAPEDLPELQNWVYTEEVLLSFGENEEEPEIEAPRSTGLQLVRVEDLAGHLARLKAQQDHLAMLRQGFAWDSATLADSECAQLGNMLVDFCEKASAENLDVYMPKAMVLVSWMMGYGLAEVLELRVLAPEQLGFSNAGFAISRLGDICIWRIPLRLPTVQGEEYTDRINSVDHIIVPDVSGLAEVLIRLHESRNPKQTLLFTWAKSRGKRIEQAISAITAIDAQHGGLKRLNPPHIQRHLRTTLLNLVPDRTIAWMLAGTAQDAVQPRMFYAVHTPQELVDWMLQAHRKMGLQKQPLPNKNQEPSTKPALLDGSMVSYAGAKFLSDLNTLKEIYAKSRRLAQKSPKGFRVKVSEQHSDIPRADEGLTPAALAEKKKRWQNWHDDVICWAWLTQALQTSLRAVKHPSLLYFQFMRNPDQIWISVEDKITRDHDESRATPVTTALRQAFETMTTVQEAYQNRWSDKQPILHGNDANQDQQPLLMPYGFVVFDGNDQPVPMSPKWITDKLFFHFGVRWPANFNRALLRRVLAETGTNGDGLDAFMGHGAVSDRVHDRHSLFDFAVWGEQLRDALRLWGQAIGLHRLDNFTRLDKNSLRYQQHASKTLAVLKSALDLNDGASVTHVSNAPAKTDFDDWCQQVTALLEATGARDLSLPHLQPWYDHLTTSERVFAHYLLRRPSKLEPQETADVTALAEMHKKEANELEDELVQAAANGALNRSVAAHGFNFAYRLCKALNPTMPTMRLAMTPAARVSPYSLERLYKAGQTEQWRTDCLSHLQDKSLSHYTAFHKEKLKLALASFGNVTSNIARWQACLKALAVSPQPESFLFDASYDYVLKRKSGTRLLRGFLNVPSTDASILFVYLKLIAQKEEDPKKLYRQLQPPLTNVASNIGQWTNGIHWWSRLVLPPLVAEHMAGTLDDQCAAGPWMRHFGTGLPESENSAAKHSKSATLNEDQEGAIVPVFDHGTVLAGNPPGWSDKFAGADSVAGQWLKQYLLSHLGCDAVGEELLNDTLSNIDPPSDYRAQVNKLIHKIRKYEDLLDDDDEEDAWVLHVDRQVVGFDTYHDLCSYFEQAIITSRNPTRQKHIRLLQMMAFRFGMRRREILGLRRIDIDLGGTGRIHIRPYPGHQLKTSFSRRSLPIQCFLSEQERAWLTEVCEGLAPHDLLIPQHEHDTISREAIAVLREVGKDSTLKLHHLRHSFASLLTLKIVLARQDDWVNVFASERNHAELAKSTELVGTLLKPNTSAGDFLVIPRLLGHSSYQVTLTHYVHTLDMVAALYLTHRVQEFVMPKRDWVHWINHRYQTCLQMREVAVQPALIQETVSATTSLSGQLQSLFVSWLGMYRGQRQEGQVPILPCPPEITEDLLQDWFSPKQAENLRDRLLTACDKLKLGHLSLLSRLGQTYWQSNPPMFWFNAKVPDRDATDHSVVADAMILLNLLRDMGCTPDDVVFWRYQHAEPHLHRQIWLDAVKGSLFEYATELRGGHAKAHHCLGISLKAGRIKRSALLGLWWMGLRSLASSSGRVQGTSE